MNETAKAKIKLHRYSVIDIKKLKHLDNNNRVHTKEQIEVLKTSVTKYGITYPILIDKHNQIVAGEGITQALIELGYDEAPVLKIDNLTDEQIRLYRIMDNVSFIKGEMDMEAIMRELADLQISTDDLYLAGLNEEDINLEVYDDMISSFENEIANELGVNSEKNGITNDDVDDKLDDDTDLFVNDGELWQLGEHRLLCGYCEIESNQEKLMNGIGAIDLMLTDPPYAVDYGKKNEFLNNYDKGNKIDSDIINDSIDAKNIKDLLINAFSGIKKYLSDKCSYYVFVALGNGLFSSISEAFSEAGFPVRHLLIWNKNNHVLGRSDYYYKHEPILYGWINTHNFYGNGEQRMTVLNYNKPQKADFHPTSKPLDLIENLIMNSTQNGDVVADIFGGSGKTLFACQNTGRKCMMIEADKLYCSKIIKIWESLTGNKAILLSKEQ